MPFCRRSTKEQYSEWICSVHWPMVPKRTRQRRSQAKRLLKRAHLHADREARKTQGYISTWRMNRIGALRRIASASWERCKREAIEAAGGLR
ncbi:hypothetical protein ACIPUD_10980 [Bradyrhizobium sp. CAR08]